ncbi:MAG: ribosome-associated translation inhibitor RaiA [Alphaproteobacteria bacterium]|nr:ribosome-associated translation inhibitor RaiA [Alphaproteobacteria bacterium]
MQIPLQITFHGLDHSDAVEERIRAKASRLEAIFNRIVSCRVVIELQHHSASFHIRLFVVVPGDELVVKRETKEAHIHEDINVALRDAFLAMERQLNDYVTRHRRTNRIEPAPADSLI